MSRGSAPGCGSDMFKGVSLLKEVCCGHDVMLDQPDQLTKALLEVAAA